MESAFTDKRRRAREVILNAANSLLRQTAAADFSMRDLAAEAGVSFATPFNQFGSKAAIIQALSARLIAEMARRFDETPSAGDAIDRVLAAVEIACSVLLEEPQVNRAIIASLGEPSTTPGQVRLHSAELWAAALDEDTRFASDIPASVLTLLPAQLALCYRGCLSFWCAGEIADEALAAQARAAAATILLGVVRAPDRHRLIDLLTPASTASSAS